MSEFNIIKGLAIPKRDVHFAPRTSKYPLDSMSEGDAFVVSCVGKNGATKSDGTKLTVKEDAERKARQKQSALAMLAKRRGIKITTRWYPEGNEEYGIAANSLVVWHAGQRTAEDEATDPTEDVPQGDDDGLLDE